MPLGMELHILTLYSSKTGHWPWASTHVHSPCQFCMWMAPQSSHNMSFVMSCPAVFDMLVERTGLMELKHFNASQFNNKTALQTAPVEFDQHGCLLGSWSAKSLSIMPNCVTDQPVHYVTVRFGLAYLWKKTTTVFGGHANKLINMQQLFTKTSWLSLHKRSWFGLK